MMTFLEAAQATGGKAINLAEPASFVGVSTDSRAVKTGELFIALRGEHFDGHDFVAAALAQGAAAAMVEAAWLETHGEDARGLPLLVVADRPAMIMSADWWG